MFFHSWTIGNDGLLMVFKILGMMVIDGKGQNCRFLDFWNSPTFQVILEKGQAETFQGFLVLTTSILVEIVLSLKTENFLTDAMQKVIGGEGQIFDPIEKFQWF